MGSSLIRYDFKLHKSDQLDVTLVLPKDNRGVVHGLVVDDCGRPVEDAVVKLFVVEYFDRDGKDEAFEPEFDDNGEKYVHKKCKLRPVTHAFTDENGQFLFGPLCKDVNYSIKVWVNDVRCSCVKFVGKCDRDCLIKCKGKYCDKCDDYHDKCDNYRDDYKDCVKNAAFEIAEDIIIPDQD